jgi:hypothetical protein
MQLVLALLASHKHKENNMGQFKPMVKMETTEPSVELKLKKGGHVNMKKGGKAEAGHKKMAMGGGAMDMMMGTPALVGRPAVNAPVRSPMKPSMASRRKAMMAKPAAPMAMPPMKKGGKMAEGGDTAQDKAMIKKAFKQHDSQEHKGGKGTDLKLKKGGMKKMATGGVALGNAGGFKTGGVALGNAGGFKTGGVTLGNAGGFKHGGKSSKKAYATGGTVDSGKPVAMPQGAKKPSQPVSTNRFTGTFKKGGTVTPAESNLMKAFGKENAPAMKSAKAQSNEVYSKYQKMNGGGSVSDKETDMSKGAYDAHYANEKAENEAMRNMVLGAPKKLMDSVKGMFSPKAPQGQGAVTKTEKSITVSPAGKRRGGRAC